MKVPEKNPLETEKNNDINDVSLYRKKKKKAKQKLETCPGGDGHNALRPSCPFPS